MPSRAHCCVSKARLAPVEVVGGGGDYSSRSLREELGRLNLRELRARARLAGVDEVELEGSLDAPDPAGAVIDLLEAQHAVAARSTNARVAELQGLHLRELRARAKLVGVDEKKLEDCLETEDPRAETLTLLLAHDAPTTTESTTQHELAGMRVTALAKRAMGAGVERDKIDEAMDSDKPKQQLIGLIRAVDTAKSDREHELQKQRRDLTGLRVAALHKRALDAGLEEQQVDDMMDSDDPKTALIELLLAAASPPATGSTDAQVPEVVDDVQMGGEDAVPEGSLVDHNLRAELSTLKLKALKARARKAGVDRDQLEDADDADDVHAAVVQLILDTVGSKTDGTDAARHALESQLVEMKLKALKRRARAAGVDEYALEDCDDEPDVKRAVLELIIEAELRSNAAANKPHFGEGPLQREQGSLVPTTKKPSESRHVMLSYQWDHQYQVKRVHDLLTKLGHKVWMDISGGMGSDIYDSMAEGVSNASVVVCFMSQKYQDSENCMLEAKYAKQCGVSLVPVMMESDWKPSSWLGVIMAGALWVRLSDEAGFEENVNQLHGQIQQVVRATAVDLEDLEVTADCATTPNEAIEELERLRDNLVPQSDAVKAAVLADTSHPATIPAGVPKLPPKFQATQQIRELTRLVLSTSAKDMAMSRVGFWGMGGIGKTVTTAAIARDDQVRLHFHAIIFIPLGQTPVIAKLQNLCHMQCTGTELPSGMSSDERKEALHQACLGKKVLLCLDDLWEAEHEHELNFADETAGSKVLISTRVQSLLSGAHQLEVGLPSASDSARMLLAAADADTSGTQPSGLREVVDLCGRLPLALGIAGRLAATLGLVGTEDWSDMISVLKEELRESHSGARTSAQEVMIRASLNGLQGSAQEQANVRALLLMFALVPEDTYCPLDVLLLMFNALHKTAGATMMHVRKWLRTLLGRSLLLGTIDRPSIHDLVLDFTIAQHSTDSLRDSHRCVVEAFRVARPVDLHGRRKFDIAQKDDPTAAYVCNEIGYHLKQGWQTNKMGDEVATRDWLVDVPLDPIGIAAGQVVGSEQITTLADAAEASKDWWLAARYWAVAQQVGPSSMTASSSAETVARLLPTRKALDAMSNLGIASEFDADKEDFELAQVANLAQTWDIGQDLAQQPELVKRVLSTQAAIRDPVSVGLIGLVTKIAPNMFTFDMKNGAKEALKLMLFLLKEAESNPDPITGAYCLQCAYNFSQCDVPHLDPDFSWVALYGENGETLITAFDNWDMETMHPFLKAKLSGDWFLYMGCPVLPLAQRWGHMAPAYKNLDRVLLSINRLIADGRDGEDTLGSLCGSISWPTVVWSCRFEPHRCEAVASMLASAGLTWSHAAAEVDRVVKDLAVIRARGNHSTEGVYHTAELFIGLIKCSYVLVAQDPQATEQEIMDDLPSAEEIVELACGGKPGCYLHASHVLMNWFLSCAGVSAKFGRHEEAIAYAAAGIVSDAPKGGTISVTTRVLLTTIRANALAALGRRAEASASFEAAISEAHRAGMFLYEAFALRDLKMNILDGIGHGEHGSRRLGAALRQLIGPADIITPLLRGLDASEMMALPEPEAGYVVTIEAQDSATSALRQELGGLQLKVLRKRAMDGGISEDQVEDALDSDDPKSTLVDLLVSVTEELTEDDQLRSELEGMRIRDLRSRAKEADIDEDEVDDATESSHPKAALIALLLQRA